MCGFVGVAGPNREQLVDRMLPLLAHRGPDGSGVMQSGSFAFGHRRLAVVDINGGSQPMVDDASGAVIVHNGEVYNHMALRKKLPGTKFGTRSDTETLLRLSLSDLNPMDWLPEIEGMFAFAVAGRNRMLIARDPLGIKPLYLGGDGTHLMFASEIRPLADVAEWIREFPPGTYVTGNREIVRYYRLPALRPTPPAPNAAQRELVQRLVGSVRASLTADVPVGAFLSGGLDSSLIVSIASRSVRRLPTFAVGMAGAPDLEYARAVAQMLGTRHRERVYTFEEALAVLPEVITHLESFDCALVRSAVPNYLLAKLASEHVKVALSGEGADELFAGYDYLRRLRGAELVKELRLITSALHNTNLQRCDRMSMAHGLEVRVPFLDSPGLLEFAMSLQPRLKVVGRQRVGKWLLRKAALAFLPAEIAARPKVKFAVGAGLADRLAAYAKERITPSEFERERRVSDNCVLTTPEELMYFRIFRERFPVDRVASLIGRSRSI